jgi:hypothetical protein
MKRIKNHILGMVSILVVAVMAGCSATAHIEKDETVNFSQYKSFGWVGDKEKSLKDRNSNAIVDANLKSTVIQELEKAGLKHDEKNPDILLDYNILVENNVRRQLDPVYTQPFTRYFYNPYSRRITPVYYPSQMIGYNDSEIPFREGTITLHMIDNDTNKLIWQGWTSDEVNSKTPSSKEVVSSVKTILKKFKQG